MWRELATMSCLGGLALVSCDGSAGGSNSAGGAAGGAGFGGTQGPAGSGGASATGGAGGTGAWFGDSGGTEDAGPVDIDAGTIDGLDLVLETPTPEQIGLLLRVGRVLSEGASVAVRYKRADVSVWQTAHPLLRIHPEWVAGGAPEEPVESFAGTIFDLEPGTDYHIELSLEEPGKPQETLQAPAATRALPPVAPPVTVTAGPQDNLQSTLDALQPGDVLELQEGTYEVSGLQLKSSGTALEPIYVRGKTRESVVLRGSGTVLQILQASHVIIENLTIQGTGVDSGTNASSRGVSFWNGALQEFVTFRDIDIVGVDQGIKAAGTVRSILVYNSVLQGNNIWTEDFLHTNLTWNDDGLRLPGEGNCAFDNTLHAFGDTFAVDNGVHSAAVYFYRNRVTMSGDDAFEADYGTRNLAFYDNYITNVGTFISLDPLWGGPLYCFRNVAINTFRGPFKLNNTNTGFMIYNNTIVRTEGRTGWGWVQFDNGSLRAWSFRNNLLIYRGDTGRLLAVESTVNNPIDFTHNAWYPDGKIWWTKTGGSFASLSAAHAGLPPATALFGTSSARHDGDVLTTDNPFTSAITLGPDHLTEVHTEVVPTLSAGATPKNAGVAIPNVTDGFAGSAPDMGAIIEGRAVSSWGAVRP